VFADTTAHALNSEPRPQGADASTYGIVFILAIKLDHYGVFPENQVDAIERRVRKNFFGYCVLRHLIVHYFYVFRSVPEVRQKYCERFDILPSRTLLLSAGLKKS